MKRHPRPRQVVRLPSRTNKRAPPVSPLRFTPYAWAKLLYLRDAGPTEIGGFGVAHPGQLLLMEDVQLVRQQCTAVTVELDDLAVADYYDQQVDAGRQLAEFSRVWIHTHPGNSPLPSATDEATFERCFGGADWAVMFILAASGSCYARLRLGDCPGGQLELPVQIDFSLAFPAASPETWESEYADCVALSPAMFSSFDLASSEPYPGRNCRAAMDWTGHVDPLGCEALSREPLGGGPSAWEAAHE